MTMRIIAHAGNLLGPLLPEVDLLVLGPGPPQKMPGIALTEPAWCVWYYSCKIYIFMGGAELTFVSCQPLYI